jgi:hypothetical protein
MDSGTQEFIHCLVASADYDSFFSVMVREGQKLEMMEAQAKIASDMQIPTTAEAKGGAAEGGSGGGKGTDDDDDDDDKGYK